MSLALILEERITQVSVYQIQHFMARLILILSLLSTHHFTSATSPRISNANNFSHASHLVIQQGITVEGTVTEKSDPLPGVSVFIKGRTVGTVTDADGKYSLAIQSPEDVIVFSFIGYKSVEEPVGLRKIINVSLEADATELDEVVVTAMGLQSKKRELAFAVREVDPQQVQESHQANLVSALAGKVPGVQITSSSGAPGASASIRVRGNKSFRYSNGPLFVVDGVIDAGARGALSVIDKNENATVGILATVGTIASQGYATALKNLQQSLGYEGKLEIIGQGGFGLAEAIDGEPGFVKRGAEHSSADYKGPSFDHEFFPIDTALMDAYNFDRTGNGLLCTETIEGGCTSLQLNAPINYARYHLVSLLEQLRKHPEAPPLKAIILGCTHYPYLKEELAKILNELYHLQINGHYRYRNQMIENVVLIDPAVNVAQELAKHLKDEALFNRDGNGDCEFFISVPNFANPDVKVIDSTHFTHVYKYGRDAGSAQEFVKVVPFSAKNISDDMLTRFSHAIPSVYDRVLRHMKSDSAQAYKLSQLKIE